MVDKSWEPILRANFYLLIKKKILLESLVSNNDFLSIDNVSHQFVNGVQDWGWDFFVFLNFDKLFTPLESLLIHLINVPLSHQEMFFALFMTDQRVSGRSERLNWLNFDGLIF